MNFSQGMPKPNGSGVEFLAMLGEMISDTKNEADLVKEMTDVTSSILTHPLGYPMRKVIEQTLALITMGSMGKNDFAKMLHEALEWKISGKFQDIARSQDGIPEMNSALDGVLASYVLFLKSGLPTLMDLASAVPDSMPEDVNMVVLENTEDNLTFILVPDMGLRIMTTGGRENADLLSNLYGFNLDEEFHFVEDTTEGWGFRTSNMPFTALTLLRDADLVMNKDEDSAEDTDADSDS